MRTTQSVCSFAVAINQRVYEVEIDQVWVNESPIERYDAQVYEAGDIVKGGEVAYVTLRGAYVAAIDSIMNTEEARNEPDV